jgi:HlyD family secretion protein
MTAAALTQERKSRPLAELVDREHRRRMRRQLITWGVLAAVPVLLVAAWFALRPRPLPFASRYRMQPVTTGDVLREVHATGHVQAVTTVEIGAEVSGRIATVDVDYNDRVKAGQVLARFDRTSLQAQLAQMNATLQASRATLEQAKTDRDQAKRNVERMARLFSNKAISEAEHDTAVSAANLADQRVRAAEAQVTAQEASLTVSRNNLDHAVIRSPIDGVIVTRNVDPGQTVASAFQTPVLFTVAADLRKMEVVAAVDEADVGEIAIRQPATFTVNAYPDRTFEGFVRSVRNSPVVVQDVVTYGTVVEVDNPDLALKPGMTASVRVRTATAKDVLRVPNGALHFTPAGESGGMRPDFWRVAGDHVERVEVTLGISDGELTEIRTGTLAAGTAAITDYTPEGKKFYGIGR